MEIKPKEIAVISVFSLLKYQQHHRAGQQREENIESAFFAEKSLM